MSTTVHDAALGERQLGRMLDGAVIEHIVGRTRRRWDGVSIVGPIGAVHTRVRYILEGIILSLGDRNVGRERCIDIVGVRGTLVDVVVDLIVVTDSSSVRTGAFGSS